MSEKPVDCQLSPIDQGRSALIVGANGGIGRALLEQVTAHSAYQTVHAWSRAPARAVPRGAIYARVDITDESSIALAAEALPSPHLTIVATGLLQTASGLGPEKSWRDLNLQRFAENFAINAIGPALVAKHVLPKLPKSGRAVFAVLSARVSSIEDNRLGGWYSYRASKAALNQIIKTLSIELARTRPEAICVGLHPGTVDTGLSRPFQANISPENLFSAEQAASQLLSVIDGLTPSDSGHLLAWDGTRIPF